MGSANSGLERLAGATIELVGLLRPRALDADIYFPADVSTLSKLVDLRLRSKRGPDPCDDSSPPIESRPTTPSARFARPARSLHESVLSRSVPVTPLSALLLAEFGSPPKPNTRPLFRIRVRASMPGDDC